MTSLPPAFFDEAARWIGTDTVTHRSNAPLVDRAERLLKPLGWETRRQKVVERGVAFFNLTARRGPAGGRPLLLNTHTDTVPPGPPERWTATGGDPFRLTRRAGLLAGLGVADVKLNLLCQIEAVRRMGAAAFRRPVVIAATYGEERGLAGARRLIAAWRGPKPALALAGEPTEMAVVHRHRGYLVFEWTLPEGPRLTGRGRVPGFDVFLRGKSAHSSTPALGVNALEKGLSLLQAFAHAGLAPRVLAADGGTAHNQVPAEARFSFLAPGWPAGLLLKSGEARRRAFSIDDPARLLPWEFLPLLTGIRDALPKSHSMNWATLRREGPRWKAKFDLRFPPEARPDACVRLVSARLAGKGVLKVLLQDPPLDAPRGSREVLFLKKVLRRAGLPATLKEKMTCTEAGLYDAWGAPAAVIGPGRSVGNIHRPNEKVSVAQLAAAVRFYEELLRAWTRTTS